MAASPQTNARMPAPILERVKQEAHKDGRSVSQWITRACIRELDRLDAERKPEPGRRRQ